MVSFNIFDQITKLYNIYYSSDDSDFNLETFNEEDFYNMIFPHLNHIIDMIKKKQQQQKDNDFDLSENTSESDINITEQNDSENPESNESEQENNQDEINQEEEKKNHSNPNNLNPNDINIENTNTNNSGNNDNYKMDIGDSQPDINFQSGNNSDNREEPFNFDTYTNTVIKPIIKKMYRILSLICHPDKNKKYRDGVIFTRIKECYDEQMLIGMINFALQFDIELDYLELNERLVNYMIIEMKKLINKILNKSMKK